MLPTNRKLKNIEDCINKSGFSVDKIKTSEYISKWTYAVVDQGKEIISWYYDGNAKIYDWKLPVIIYWDHTNVVKFIDFPFICWADWVKVFNFKEWYDTKYFYYVLTHLRPETQWYRRHYSLLKEKEIPLPPLATQHKIVALLDEASVQITASKSAIQSQLDALDQLWQSSLSEVFENEEWKQDKLWNILDFNYGKWLDKLERSDIGSYPVYGANGIMNYSEQYLFEWESIIVWRKWSAWAITKVAGKFRPSDVTYYVTLKKQGNIDFIYYLLSTLNLPSYAQWVKPWINRNTVYDLHIKYPDITTQTRIVAQLDDLSQNIVALRSQYTTQLQHFDDLRASILDQAFKGELVEE